VVRHFALHSGKRILVCRGLLVRDNSLIVSEDLLVRLLVRHLSLRMCDPLLCYRIVLCLLLSLLPLGLNFL
jgi:hypothetical protein